ncbi:hypothetical protein QL285_034318 [Trifolium repens]|nr:hypothetical protein QL285_034318 [Trifolium repens]
MKQRNKEHKGKRKSDRERFCVKWLVGDGPRAVAIPVVGMAGFGFAVTVRISYAIMLLPLFCSSGYGYEWLLIFGFVMVGAVEAFGCRKKKLLVWLFLF